MPEKKTVRFGPIFFEVQRYADGRFGFDYKNPDNDRIKVRLHSQDEACERALEILKAARGGTLDRSLIDDDLFLSFLRWRSEQALGAEIPKVKKEYMDIKKRAGLAPPTISELESTLRPFAERFTGNIAHVKREQVAAFLDERSPSPRRWNNMRNAIVGMWRFARREGYLPATLTSVETMELRKVSLTVHTYSKEELLRLLAVVEKEWLPLIVLGAFCGLRPEEIQPNPRHKGYKPGLQWQNINWNKGIVDVPAGVAKDRRRRFAPLTDAARAFLSDWKSEKGFVVPARATDKPRARWVKDSGVTWRKDALRHSFASYRLAVRKNMPELTLEMGNSAAMVHRHYLDLKHEEDGVSWFGIRPEEVPKVPLPPL